MTRAELLEELRELKPRLGESANLLPEPLTAHGYAHLQKARIWDAASRSVPPLAEKERRLRSELDVA